MRETAQRAINTSVLDMDGISAANFALDILVLAKRTLILEAAVNLIHDNAEPLMTEDGEVYCVTEDCFARFKDALDACH